MDERILSDDGHWWWDGSNWLPVEENTHEPINQPLKAAARPKTSQLHPQKDLQVHLILVRLKNH